MSIKLPIESSPQQASKILKFFFGLSIVTYFGMTFLIEKVILMDTEAGFVYEPYDEKAMMLLYGAIGAAFFLLILQFIIPKQIHSHSTTPGGHFAADIVRYVFCEAIAVFGFLLFLISSQTLYAWIFMGVAMFTLFLGDVQDRKAL